MNEEVLHPVVVTSISREAPGHARLGFRAPTIMSSHVSPGQYALTTLPGFERPRPLALANMPGDDFEVMFKDDDENFPKVGAAVAMSTPKGHGFAIGDIRGNDVLLVGTGTGIAPLISLIRTLMSRRADVARIGVVIGARNESFRLFRDVLSEARGHQISVDEVFSRPEAGVVDKKGYVQDHLPEWITDRTIVYVCGQPAMMDAVGATVARRGVPSSNVRRNF